MTAAIVWKEVREQSAVWLAMVLLAVAVLQGGRQLMDSPPTQGTDEILLVVAVMLAWGHGLACGAALLAGEREQGTQAFLDQLPVSRAAVWRAKLLAGVLLGPTCAAAIGGIAAGAGLRLGESGALVVMATLAGGVYGLVLGMGVSSRAGSTLEAIGWAVAALVLGTPVVLALFLFPVALVFTIAGARDLGWLVPAIWLAGFLVLPLPVCALHYTRPDRRRLDPAVLRGADAGHAGLAGLCWRQFRWLLAGVVAFGIVAGFGVIANGFFVYPAVSLLVGTMCGAWMFLDEQAGAWRFLGEQRFPLGRLWWHKVFWGLACLVVGCMALFLPMGLSQAFADQRVVVEMNRNLGADLLGLTIPHGPFFVLWPLAGFASGALMGLLFRKPLIALMVAFTLAVLLCVPWIPSMLCGGLPAWMPLLPPLVLLAASRLLVHPWATGQLGSARAVAGTSGGLLLAGVLVAGGLAWRVLEIPDVPEPPEMQEFVGRLSAADNEASLLTRQALADMLEKWRGEPPVEIDGREWDLLEDGWVPDEDLATWLDERFKGGWAEQLADAAAKPGAMLVDPRRLTLLFDFKASQAIPVRLATYLLAARGLRVLKEKQDVESFLKDFGTGLALIRAMENAATIHEADLAVILERRFLQVVPRWVEQATGGAKELRRAAAVLRNHRANLPPNDHVFADYIIARGVQSSPERTIAMVLPSEVHKQAAGWVALAGRAPWEQARIDRSLRAWAFGGPGTQAALPPLFVIPLLHGRRNPDLSTPGRVFHLDSTEALVALALYRVEKGKPAGKLTDLVPDYLPKIPPGLAMENGHLVGAGQRVAVPERLR